ncbi:carboxypeptidase-like regulatory domain-containing protein [Gimesia sp.]|uniref:carboxypeptidase-like regulatory domain-containing protein n=1 Tax=Gimesia sp. TaxID=2024833 RepID=UPI003A8ED23C
MASQKTCRFSKYLFALLSLNLTVGCSSKAPDTPETVPVAGSVSFQGKPLPGASVIFMNPDATSPQTGTLNSITDDSGKFELKSYFGARTVKNGAVPGTYKVTILKMVPPGEMTVNEYEAKVAEADRIVSGGGVLTQEQTPPELQQLIPRKYSDASLSRLEAKVMPNQENKFQFDLK